MDNGKDINWEERRFWAATIILAGMCAKPNLSISVSYAVNRADELIKLLADPQCQSSCAPLNQKQKDEKVSE